MSKNQPDELDIRSLLPSSFKEEQLNDLLTAVWEAGAPMPVVLVCTMAQKRCIHGFSGSAFAPLKRTLRDRLRGITRYSNGTVQWRGDKNYMKFYDSDFGRVDIETRK